MVLHRKHVWLLTAPLACLAGCATGPMSRLAERDPVISLQQADPVDSKRRASLGGKIGLDLEGVSTAQVGATSDADAKRMVMLSGSRRRMNQQMMMQMMMTPQVPLHQPQATPAPSSAPTRSQQGGSGNSSGAPRRSTAPARTQSPQMAQTPNPMMMQPMMMPGMMPMGMMPMDGMPPTGIAGRRAARAQRNETKSKEDSAATVEADRIARAAAAEAERAERAAEAEAMIVERRLQAEAELVERMTRAEMELAERLATAKEERDRRIALAQEERNLRLQIIGINPTELGSDPVDDALAKMERSREASANSSAMTRFTRFFRSGSEETTVSPRTARDFESSLAGQSKTSPTASRQQKQSGDLIERTLNHSTELLDRPSIASIAASVPEVDAPSTGVPVATVSRSKGPENLHPSLFGESKGTNRSTAELDSMLAKSGSQSKSSLLDDFPLSATPRLPSAAGETGDTASKLAPEFPLTASTEKAPAAADRELFSEAAKEPPATIAEVKPSANDIWVLDQGLDIARFEDAKPVAEKVPVTPVREENFSEPGGVYAKIEEPVRQPSRAAEFPDRFSVPSRLAGSDRALDPATGEAPSVAAMMTPAIVPQSTQPQVAAVVHQQIPTVQAPIRNAAWTAQSLREACGPLPAELESLVRQLDIPETGVRKEVLADLARLGEKARPALPAVRVLLEDTPIVAAHAAWTIWEIEQNESQTVRELVRLLQTGDPETVQFTAYALGSLGPKALEAAPVLRAERERLSGPTRIHVAEALTRIDAFDRASVEVLIVSLQHTDPYVRWMAAIALGQSQSRYADVAVPALVQALRDQDAEVRAAAALSVGGFGSAASSAVPELQSRASLDAPAVREAAQTALACIHAS